MGKEEIIMQNSFLSIIDCPFIIHDIESTSLTKSFRSFQKAY